MNRSLRNVRCPVCIAAQTRLSRDHSEASRRRIDTAMRADEELEPRVAKANSTRNVHHDETKKKKKKVALNGEIDMGASVWFGTSSSSASGAALLECSTASASGAAMIPPQVSPSVRGTERDAQERSDATTTTQGEERGGTFLQKRKFGICRGSAQRRDHQKSNRLA